MTDVNKSATFGEIVATLTIEDGVSTVFLEGGHLGQFTGTLEIVDLTEQLENEHGETMNVQPETLLDIRMWAEENGY